MYEQDRTKQLLAQALLQLTLRKSFTKITIADITLMSEFNRQTFYYHFRDKYELLTWMYERDAASIFDCHLNFDNWHQYMETLLRRYKTLDYFYLNTVHSDDTYFADFIFKLTENIFYRAIETLDAEHHLRKEDKRFYAQFFSYGIQGVLIRWITSNMKDDALHIASNLKNLAQDSIQVAYQRYHATLRNTLKEKGETL